MSTTDTPNQTQELTDEERELFERLADKHKDDDEVSRICELVLQSSSEGADKEVTNS